MRLRTILIEVFKCIRELNPKFMNMLFTLNNKPYDTRSGPLLFQSHVKTIKHGINSFVYQGAKRWNSLPTDAKDIECFNRFKNFLTTWMGPDCHCGYCKFGIGLLDFWKPIWSTNDILTIAVIQRLLEIVFNNYFIPADYFMCLWKILRLYDHTCI